MSAGIAFTLLARDGAARHGRIETAHGTIETPAFTRRTLDWLRTSLLNGMSREGDNVIF